MRSRATRSRGWTRSALLNAEARELEERASELEEGVEESIAAVEQDVRALEYRIEAEAAAARRSAAPSQPAADAERPRTPGANAAGDALVGSWIRWPACRRRAAAVLEARPRSAFEEFRQNSRGGAERAEEGRGRGRQG